MLPKFIRRGFFIGVLLLGTSLAHGGEKIFNMPDLISLKYPSSLALSPDGQYVAFVIREANLEESFYYTNLWIVRTDGTDLRPLTSNRYQNRSPQWSPDSQWLAFLSNRPYSNSKGEKRQTQIWLLYLRGGDAQRLTDASRGVHRFRWSPDGKSIAYVTTQPLSPEEKKRRQERRQRKFDARVVDEPKQPKEIWLIEVATRKSRRIHVADPGVRDIAFSPDGQWIVYSTNYTGEYDDEQKYDLWLVSLKDSTVRQLTDFPGPETSPQFSPDGSRIAYISQTVPDIEFAQTDISLIPFEGGKPQNLTTQFHYPVGSFIWSPDGQSLYFEGHVRTHNFYYRLRLKDRSIRPVLKEDRRFFSHLRISRDGKLLAYLAENAYALPDIFVRRRKKERPLTHYRKALEDYALGEQKIIRWRSVDGEEIEGLLVTPVGYQPGHPVPLILMIHGGPFSRFRDTFRQHYFFQYFAGHGYAILAPNPRGSSGYSDRFGQANRYDLGGKDYQDLIAGVDEVIRRGIADSTRLGVMGGSYGGYLTNWVITQTPRFKAAVSLYGIFSLLTDWSNSIQPSWEKMYFGAYYWENLDVYLKHSPAFYVTRIQTPVLIMHGEEDELTFISNSKEMYQALKILGKPVQFVIYPREGHGIAREPNHRIDVYQRALQWFDKYLK